MSGQWAGGKGSGRRPMAVDKDIYESNWDKIFNKKDYNKKEEEVIEDLDWETPEMCNFGTLNEVIDNHPIRGKKD